MECERTYNFRGKCNTKDSKEEDQKRSRSSETHVVLLYQEKGKRSDNKK